MDAIDDASSPKSVRSIGSCSEVSSSERQDGISMETEIRLQLLFYGATCRATFFLFFFKTVDREWMKEEGKRLGRCF